MDKTNTDLDVFGVKLILLCGARTVTRAFPASGTSGWRRRPGPPTFGRSGPAGSGPRPP